jgi:hypothetical protein
MLFLLLMLSLTAPAPAPCTGKVVRHQAPLIAFKKQHPCPVSCRTYVKRNGKMVLYQKCGACNIDHVCPLACCGKDVLENMQWLDAAANRKKSDNCRACQGTISDK